MTANRHRGEVEITLAGKSYVMRPTFGALAAIEAKTGEGIAELLERMRTGRVRITDVTAVIWAGLGATGEPVTYEKVGELVAEIGLDSLAVPVSMFLLNACKGGQASGEARAAEPVDPA